MSATSTTTTIDETPRVWLGCLACYGAGALVGHWFDAVDADEITVADVHRGSGRNYSQCEELYCLDHEYLPVDGELSPHEAAEWGRVLASVDEQVRPALRAWVASGSYVAEGDGDLPSLPDFEERFCGEFDSFQEYAEQLGEDIGLLDGVPDEISAYFDWAAWARDLAFDHETADAPIGVYVFRNAA